MDDKIKLIYERMQDYLRQVEKIESDTMSRN